MTDLNLQVTAVTNAIDMLLREFPELIENDGDEQLFRDTLEGCTNADEIMSRIAIRIREEHQQQAAMKFLQHHYKDRAEAAASREKHLRYAARRILMRSGLPNWKVPEGTFYLIEGRDSLDIHTPEHVPDEYCMTVPDKTAIWDALKAGEEVPGCALSRGTPSIGLR